MTAFARTATLGSLAEQTQEERSAFVLDSGRAQLEEALRQLRHDDADAFAAMSIERLAWAVAFNVSYRWDSGVARSPRKHCYLDYWPIETPWSDVWHALSAPTESEGDGRLRLTELAASVACEQRADWQHP